LEVIAMGQTLRKVEASRPGQTELKVDMTVPADESLWIAARATSTNGGLAHTSPVYVITGGEPILDRVRGPELVKKRMAALEHIERLLQEPRYLSGYAAGEAEAHRERVRQTRKKYEGLLR
jgi:hypothetical protein